MLISVIIPVLNEGAAVVPLLQQLQGMSAVEVIVVDGGSNDNTIALAKPLCDQVLLTTPGRGQQQNWGAGHSLGEVLLFLHADSRLSPGLLGDIRQAIRRGAKGGCCQLSFDNVAAAYRLIAWGSNLRARLWRSFYGDQGIFVTRSVFEALGGFRGYPLMEDVEFSQRLRKRAPVTVVPATITTSSRRFAKNGVCKTLLLMQVFKLLFAMGLPPATLARWYQNVR